MVGVGLAFVALGALAFLYVSGQLSEASPMIAITNDVQRGAVVTADDVAVVSVVPDPVLAPISADRLDEVVTFHLLLRLLDRAPALRAIAEEYEERQVEEQERAARRKARRAAIKADSWPQPRPVPAPGQPGHQTLRGQLAGSPTNGGATPASGNGKPRIEAPRDEQLDILRERIHTSLASETHNRRDGLGAGSAYPPAPAAASSPHC